MNQITELTWEDISKDSITVATTLNSMGKKWKGIVAVTRGGLIPSSIIAQQLNIRFIQTICIQTYDDKVGKQPHLLGSEAHLQMITDDGEDWLVIDDLIDSGVTMRLIKKVLPKAFNVVLYSKIENPNELVNFYLRSYDSNTWMHFPWEL